MLTDHAQAAAKVARLLTERVSIAPASKSLDSAISDYRDALGELVQNLLRGGASHFGNKGSFQREFKAEIKSAAKDTFEEAWTEGGGDLEATEADDLELMQEFVSEQQSHVNDFADWLTDKGSDLDAVPGRLDAWAASMENFGERIRARAQGDPMLTYDGRPGEKDPCDECDEYTGQRHRLSYWEKRGLTQRNGNENFGCRRFDNCHHHFYNDAGEVVIS